LVLGTSDQSAGFEPATLVSWTTWQPNGALFETPDRAVHAQDEWLSAIRSRCEQAISQRTRSPIHPATMRAVQSLAGHCSEIQHDGATCIAKILALHSDLRENVEQHTHDALAELSRARSRGVTPNPRLVRIVRIGTKGVEVHVCGLADTSVVRRQEYVQPDVLIEVWRPILGDETTFDAACPTDTVRAAESGTGGQ
jgi:hypothetical protein